MSYDHFSSRRMIPGVINPPSSYQRAALHALCVLCCYTLLFVAFFSPVLFSDYLLAPGDGILYFLPNYYAPRAWWDTSLWAGFPAIADSQRMNWYPPALLLSLVPRTWNLFVVSAYVLAASFTYGYVYALTRSKLAASVSGCVYGLCGFLLAHLGHPALIHVAAWLPLCLWAFEMLRRREASSLWFAGGALGIACAALAGHPQMFAYTLILCAAAILYGGRDAGVGLWRYYRRAALSATLGVGLAALQLVPTAELANESLRASLSLTEFNSYSLPLTQLPMLVFPLLYGGSPGTLYDLGYFGAWGSEDGGWGAAELTGYVGLLPLMLAAVGVFAHRRRALVWFWLGVAFVALLLTLGEATPLAALIYRVPVLNKFRVPARHFMELALAISVLAGCGVRAIQERAASARLIRNILMTACGLISACLLIVQLLAGHFNARALERLGHAISFAPWANLTVGVPLFLLLAGGAVLFYWTRRPDSAPRGALVVAVLICDLASLGWFMEWHYGPPYDAYTQAPAAAAALRGPLAAAHQRIVPVRGGLGRVSELPPNLSKLWGFDSASGYGPFIPSRLSRLLTMPPHGSLDGDWRAPDDQSLDLLAARYVTVPRQETNAPLIADARGAQWSAQDLGVSVGQGCGAMYPEVFQIELPSPVEATSVGIVSALACAEGLGDQSETARVTVTSIDGRTQALNLRAGSESSEWAYDCADVRPLMRHARAEVFRSYPATRGAINCEGHDYVARLPLPSGAMRITSVEVRWTGAAFGSLALKKINFFDERSHQATPLHASAASLSDPSRWRHVADISFANSNYGEEVKPEDVGASRVYENLRARPRAWLVPEVLTLAAEQAADAIRSSRLPDNRAFDPSRLALVEEPLAFKAESFDPQASTQIVRLTDGVMEVQTKSAAPAFLVTSDVYYPGWRAIVDDEPAQLYRANYVLRGVLLPAGEHLVRFSFRPASFYYGAAISIASLLILIVLAFFARTKANHPRWAHEE